MSKEVLSELTCFAATVLAIVFLQTALASAQVVVEPGQTCSRFMNAQCGKGHWCEPPAGACGFTLFGRCVSVPEVCTQQFEPVCGCDGKTYGNDCKRRAAKVQKASDGPCR